MTCAWTYSWKQPKIKQSKIKQFTLLNATEEQQRLTKVNNAETLKKREGCIIDQIYCREGALEDRKQNDNIWHIIQAATESRWRTFQITPPFIRCVCNRQNHNSEYCRKTMVCVEKKVKLGAERRWFRCSTRNHNKRICKASITCKICTVSHVMLYGEPDLYRISEWRYRYRKINESKAKYKRSWIRKHKTAADGKVCLLETAMAWVQQNTLRRRKSKVSKNLECKTIRMEKLTIASFGDLETERMMTLIRAKHCESPNREVHMINALQMKDILR